MQHVILTPYFEKVTREFEFVFRFHRFEGSFWSRMVDFEGKLPGSGWLRLYSQFIGKLVYSYARARVNATFCDDPLVHLGIYKGSVWSSFQFIIMLEGQNRPYYVRSKWNFKRTKIMTCSENAVKVTEEDKLPGAVCRKGVGSNSIPCQFCRCLVSNRCSGIRSNLKENWNFKCKICLNQQTDMPEAFPGIELND